MNSLLFLTLSLNVAIGVTQAQVRHEDDRDEAAAAGPVNPSKFHVDIYSHPKTTFSCEGKQAGEYYADPEAKCAIYFICLENVNGGLSAMSFACPNSTIFNQATRVCSPEDQVFCSLATRFYDSVNGHIDSKGKDVKTLSSSSTTQSQSWIWNQQKKRQDQRRPSATNIHAIPIPSPSQTVPETRVKQFKGNHNSRIPPPKVLSVPPPSVRKVPKSLLSIPSATKKPESRDYEDPVVEEEMEYENTSSARNQ